MEKEESLNRKLQWSFPFCWTWRYPNTAGATGEGCALSIYGMNIANLLTPGKSGFYRRLKKEEIWLASKCWIPVPAGYPFPSTMDGYNGQMSFIKISMYRRESSNFSRKDKCFGSIKCASISVQEPQAGDSRATSHCLNADNKKVQTRTSKDAMNPNSAEDSSQSKETTFT